MLALLAIPDSKAVANVGNQMATNLTEPMMFFENDESNRKSAKSLSARAMNPYESLLDWLPSINCAKR